MPAVHSHLETAKKKKQTNKQTAIQNVYFCHFNSFLLILKFFFLVLLSAIFRDKQDQRVIKRNVGLYVDNKIQD